MQGLGGLILSRPTPIEHRTAPQTEQTPGPALDRNPLIPPPSSHVAFCVWPICPTTRSTGSADMRQPFGAKPAGPCLLLMFWIAADHRIEGPVSGLAAATDCRPTRATTIELPAPNHANSAPQPYIRSIGEDRTMMQSCASAAKLRGGGSILHNGWKAMVFTTDHRHLGSSSADPRMGRPTSLSCCLSFALQSSLMMPNARRCHPTVRPS